MEPPKADNLSAEIDKVQKSINKKVPEFFVLIAWKWDIKPMKDSQPKKLPLTMEAKS